METESYFFHEAIYSKQRIPHFAGNLLIEALPLIKSEEDVLKGLLSLPQFHPDQREWAKHERFQMICQLTNFMLPFERHIQMVYALDSMMRQGYVGRIPRSAKSIEIFKKLHDKSLLKPVEKITPQLSGALIGISGMGKTTILKRFLSTIPKVIHHPNLGLFQIPHLHIEMPYDGASVKGLAHSIFRKVDNLLPGAEYSAQYTSGSSGAETLMNHAARLLHMHHVGLLVVDEIQNLANSPKNRQSLMSLLVSASNELGVPILFVGTGKARQILNLNFRQARRSVGLGIPSWENFEKGQYDDSGDWDVFSRTLLSYQWVRKEAKVTPFLTDLLYDLSQGIVDVAIKLVAIAQIRAIMDDSETITGQLLADVARSELRMVSPMVDALRRRDIQALHEFDDIQPINLEELIVQSHSGHKRRSINIASVLSPPDSFAQIADATKDIKDSDDITAVVSTTKFGVQETQSINSCNQPNLLHETEGAVNTKSTSKNKSKKRIEVELSSEDYRNVLRDSSRNVPEEMKKLGMLPDLETLFVI